jgi:hypothetical protein
MARLLRMRLFAAALLLPLVAFATATGGHWLRCRVTGAVLSDCCCGAIEDAPSPAATTVSEADCCERVVRSVTQTVAEMSASTAQGPVAPLGVLALATPSAEIGTACAAVGAVGRRGLAPPTAQQRLVAKRTLLI